MAGNQQVASTGRDLVARELRDRGARDVQEVAEGRRKELRAVNPAGRRIGIRVKTKRAGTWQPSLREADGDFSQAGVDRAWVFVDLGGSRPAFYVVRSRTSRRTSAGHTPRPSHSTAVSVSARPTRTTTPWRSAASRSGGTAGRRSVWRPVDLGGRL